MQLQYLAEGKIHGPMDGDAFDNCIRNRQVSLDTPVSMDGQNFRPAIEALGRPYFERVLGSSAVVSDDSMIPIICPACGMTVRLPPSVVKAGEVIVCPGCSEAFGIPEMDPEELRPRPTEDTLQLQPSEVEHKPVPKTMQRVAPMSVASAAVSPHLGGAAFSDERPRRKSRLGSILLFLLVASGLGAGGYFGYLHFLGPGVALRRLMAELPSGTAVVGADLDALSSQITDKEAEEFLEKLRPNDRTMLGEYRASYPQGQRGVFALSLWMEGGAPAIIGAWRPGKINGEVWASMMRKNGYTDSVEEELTVWRDDSPQRRNRLYTLHNGTVYFGKSAQLLDFLKGRIVKERLWGANETFNTLSGKMGPMTLALIVDRSAVADFVPAVPKNVKAVLDSGAQMAGIDVSIRPTELALRGWIAFPDEATAQAQAATLKDMANTGLARLKTELPMVVKPLETPDVQIVASGSIVTVSTDVPKVALDEGIDSKPMAKNEIAAFRACRIYAEAQDIYRRTDWDKDGILEFAQNLGDGPGATGDGGGESLYKTKDGKEIALISREFAYAEGTPGTVSTPWNGYYFIVQTGQMGDNPRSYIVGENMTSGYALFAYPAEYGKTGRNSFQISNSGTVYVADLGPDTASKVDNYLGFDPNKKDDWRVTAEE